MTDHATPSCIASPTQPREVVRNSIQVNILVVVDVARAIAGGGLEDAVMLVDNSVDRGGRPSRGRGTSGLATQAQTGMVLNWIVYPVGPFGDPVPATIDAITFAQPVCFQLQSYGAIDIARSPNYIAGLTPAYDYWAGLVLPGLAERSYPYDITLRLGEQCMTLAGPKLDVWDIPAASDELLLRGGAGEPTPVRLVG
jgi:hypothetical protein